MNWVYWSLVRSRSRTITGMPALYALLTIGVRPEATLGEIKMASTFWRMKSATSRTCLSMSSSPSATMSSMFKYLAASCRRTLLNRRRHGSVVVAWEKPMTYFSFFAGGFGGNSMEAR